MSDWQNLTLGDIFEISSSKRVLQRDWKSHGIPFYRAREIVKLARDGEVENELFISEELYAEYREKYGVPAEGDLMVSAVGTLGACYVVGPRDRFYYKDASVLRFRAKRQICPRFILHSFRTDELLDQIHSGSGSTVGTYTIERANATRIRIPPLIEQRRIATVLDKADSICAKRQKALAYLDSLAQSVFIEMFGDPVTNPKNWRAVSFVDFFSDETSTCAKIKTSSYQESGIFPIVDQGQKRVAGYCDNEASLAPVSLPVTVFGDHTRIVKYIDFPFVVGADGAKVLKAADAVNPRFASHLLGVLPIADLGYSRHMKEVKRLTFISPAKELQDCFEARLLEIDKIRGRLLHAQEQSEILRASLKHRAFRGQL